MYFSLLKQLYKGIEFNNINGARF